MRTLLIVLLLALLFVAIRLSSPSRPTEEWISFRVVNGQWLTIHPGDTE